MSDLARHPIHWAFRGSVSYIFPWIKFLWFTFRTDNSAIIYFFIADHGLSVRHGLGTDTMSDTDSVRPVVWGHSIWCCIFFVLISIIHQCKCPQQQPTEPSKTTNQNSLFRSRDCSSANQGPVFPDSVGSWKKHTHTLVYTFVLIYTSLYYEVGNYSWTSQEI